ncbi:MAG: LysR family transcriptional regulator [Burkholderiaceae bacterium]|nr:LysR family transcriptional regulator [Sulfuritalea sp.]MCF8176035.1 LysR family transcriptional regulator [Burkholderiaceae bacterium]MCF8184711.1 LysR family transcriptional regulator [Polynucleobacter sp.]
MPTPATTSASSVRSLPRLRWSWDFGPLLAAVDTRRLLALLTALEAEGALGKAAAQAGMSYRSAWGLLRDCEQALGAALVSMERGRGSRLTEFGEALVKLDAAAREALDVVHAPWQKRLEDLLAPVVRATPERLRLAASHDLALADWVEHGRRIRFELFWRGSEEALAGLGRDEADIAGFHVPEGWSGEQLALWLGRWLKPKLHVCLPLMRRCQGLIVARGNPHRLATLADASKRGLRMVNRQRGSGTRSLIDQLLAANGLRPESIAGYAHEEFTHEAIAATVAAGQADVGFGIEAAAARYDLGFVPVVWERYGFALRQNVADSLEGKQFLARLQGNTFRQRLIAMPGYEPLPVGVPGAWSEFLT